MFIKQSFLGTKFEEAEKNLRDIAPECPPWLRACSDPVFKKELLEQGYRLSRTFL